MTVAIPKSGERVTLSAQWHGAPVSCELVYERHPAAGSLAYPGEAVAGHGNLGGARVTRNVSEKGAEVYVSVDGPVELDPMEGGFFCISAEGATLQDALDSLDEQMESIKKWCCSPFAEVE